MLNCFNKEKKLKRYIERAKTPSDLPEGAPVIVLGAAKGYNKRMFKGVATFKLINSPLLIFSGFEEDVLELRRLALTLGVLPRNIAVETDSTNTIGHGFYLSKLFDLLGRSKNRPIVVVTEAYHMPRSIWVFKKFGFTNVFPVYSDESDKVMDAATIRKEARNIRGNWFQLLLLRLGLKKTP